MEEIGNAKSGCEGIGRIGKAEIVREDARSNEAGDAAEEDACADEEGGGAERLG